MYRRKDRSVPSRNGVLRDWFAALPREKHQLYDTIVRRWDSSFAMVGVALSDAISFRARGEVICAREHAILAGQLLERLIGPLIASCEVMAARGRSIAETPAVEPLHYEFFRGHTGQCAASWNGVLHHVFFGDRARFFKKLGILGSTLERLEKEFQGAVEEIRSKPAAQWGACWKTLDCLHFDLNTCMREVEVTLKSFLFALPSEQLSALASDFDALPAMGRTKVKPRLSRAPA
jgi:hypothetical protein